MSASSQLPCRVLGIRTCLLHTWYLLPISLGQPSHNTHHFILMISVRNKRTCLDASPLLSTSTSIYDTAQQYPVPVCQYSVFVRVLMSGGAFFRRDQQKSIHLRNVPVTHGYDTSIWLAVTCFYVNTVLLLLLSTRNSAAVAHPLAPFPPSVPLRCTM